ncbi:MAG TPA: hypothetical protein VJ652_05430 [Noviherbaspirillum sp.]|nr:hypothetical protein [Noviherbaspirillum sp.]
MGYGFPALLAYAFGGAFLLGLLKTGRWKAILIAVIAVWCVRIGPNEIHLLLAGTTQAYGWFAFWSAGVVFPTFVVAMVGSDLGMRLHRILFMKNEEADPVALPHEAQAEEAEEQ